MELMKIQYSQKIVVSPKKADNFTAQDWIIVRIEKLKYKEKTRRPRTHVSTAKSIDAVPHISLLHALCKIKMIMLWNRVTSYFSAHV